MTNTSNLPPELELLAHIHVFLMYSNKNIPLNITDLWKPHGLDQTNVKIDGVVYKVSVEEIGHET